MTRRWSYKRAVVKLAEDAEDCLREALLPSTSPERAEWLRDLAGKQAKTAKWLAESYRPPRRDVGPLVLSLRETRR